MTQVANIVLGGLFTGAVLFLVAAGLQLVFGVQKIFNLATGSFYALGAYAGVTAVRWLAALGLPAPAFVLSLLLAGVVIGLVVGPLVELLLRQTYARGEVFQLLLTFAVVLVVEDLTRLVWGSFPLSTESFYLLYGQVMLLGVQVPTYNLVVIGAALLIAVVLGLALTRTRWGRIVRAAAENRDMIAALGVNIARLNVQVFTLGAVLSALGGALVIPASATRSEMGVDIIVIAFAVVVIGGLGSMQGALVGALIVGVLTSLAVSAFPLWETPLIYLIVVAVLILRPAGIFGSRAAEAEQ